MAQVKFYSKPSFPTENVDENGVYFIQGGELYKGLQRFGLGRVTSSATDPENAARGDINFKSGVPYVYDGNAWQKLGGDAADVRAIVSSMTSGLSRGGAGSYITGIVQNPDGSVTASAEAFPTLDTGDNAGEVKLGDDAAKVNGWDALVANVSSNAIAISGLSTTIASVSSRVTGIESIVDVSNSTVTADSGVFTNLTVSDTATFDVTNIVASSLTVNGSTIGQIADSRIAAISSVTQTGASNGITVSVTTSAGSVTAVSVDATAFGNVMSFKGVVTALPSEGNKAGDIVVIGASPTGAGLVQGQEYIYSGTDWELIGDQNSYALNAYTSTAAVYAGATTLPAAVSKAGAAIDTLNTSVSALKTKTDAYVGGSVSAADKGVAVTVDINASTMAPTVTMTVDVDALRAKLGVTTTVSDNNSTKLTTEGAVKTYVDTSIAGLDANVSTGTDDNVSITITEVDGKLTAVTATFDWITD